MATADINAAQLGIGRALKDSWLRVPKHQREYAWEEEHVVQLFRDFAAAINRDPPSPYFLGTIVAVRDEDGALLILDGQQRLATTSLLLAAMRGHLIGIGAKARAEVIERHLWDIDSDLQEPVTKLRLNITDATLFRDLITGDKPSVIDSRRSHERLRKADELARQHVRDIVAGRDTAGQSDELNRWIKFIQARAEVVLLTVPDRSAAFRIFRTLNDRGLSASEADLIKSYLFEKAGDRDPQVERDWATMAAAIESAMPDDRDAVLDFLRYALIVQAGHLRESDIFDYVEKAVFSPTSAGGVAATVAELAEVFVASRNFGHDRWQAYPTSMRKSLADIVDLDIKPMRPLVMAVCARMSPTEAAAAVGFLVSLGVRLNIASNTRSGAVEVPLAAAAQAVFARTITTATDLINHLAGLTPPDRVFRDEFARARVSNARLARYYLRRLEDVFGEPDPYKTPVDDTEKFDLEHVLPRKPDGEWGIDPDEVGVLATRLGNLALVKKSDNGRLRSATFDIKRHVLRQQGFQLTTIIADKERWGADQIEERQARLADLAVRAWPIKPSAKPRRQPRAKRERRSSEDVNEAAYRIVREATGT
jgi:hypothetical protein